MATPTYTPIASITLGSSASSVTFSSIPQDYRDLVLVINAAHNRGQATDIRVQFNSDTGSNYSRVVMEGDGSSTASNAFSGLDAIGIGNGGASTSDLGTIIAQMQDYSATDKHKTVLARSSFANSKVFASAGRYASTSAITSIDVYPPSFDWVSGGTFALYGIAS